MEIFRIYTDCLINLFLFLSIDLFINTFFKCKSKSKQLPTRTVFLILWCLFSFIPSIPYSSLVALSLEFMYSFLLLDEPFRTRLSAFIKFEIYYYLGSTIIALLYTLLVMDIPIYKSNEVYAQYTNIIGAFLLYIILSMYIIHKKLSDFCSGKIYKRYFTAITIIAILLLIVCSMLLSSTIIKQEDIVLLIFSLSLIITLLCISIYHKVITILEESARAKMEVEKNALQLDYQEHIEENLKTLSTLRHDFKNHLIIIQEYAKSGNLDKLQSYINSIQEEMAPTALIDTPSHLISSLLNVKNETCKRRGIKLNFEYNFRDIQIDDFYMVTILSNLMDNAITAATKCENGHVDLSISSINSYLEINCINNHKEKIVIKNDVFQTTKTAQKEIHGLGIISIRKTVEKLRGKIKINYTEDLFEVNILIPNY